MKNHSKVIPCSTYSWKGVERKEYKTNSQVFKDIHRYSLLGEGENESELNFHTRYFEISPGGYSSLETHRHPHSVVVIRGGGSVVLNNETHNLGLHDVVFISPGTIHQFHADKNDHLGFICIVDRYRDKPAIPDDDQIQKYCTSPEVLNKIRR